RKAMAAQLATIAAAFEAQEPQKQEKSKPTATTTVTTAGDTSTFEKPELASSGVVAANHDLEANGHQWDRNGHELSSEQVSPRRELADTVWTPPVEVDSRHEQ